MERVEKGSRCDVCVSRNIKKKEGAENFGESSYVVGLKQGCPIKKVKIKT